MIDDDDDDWLDDPLTPEEMARAESAANGPTYDMNTLERIMRPWNQIDVSGQEAVLLHLNRSTKTHYEMVKDAADTPVGPLVKAIERHHAMIRAIITAMKVLAGNGIAEAAAWIAIDPGRKDFIIGNLLGFYAACRANYKNALDNGLIDGAKRFDDVAEAALAAATTLGWVDRKGAWGVESHSKDDGTTVITATWAEPK